MRLFIYNVIIDSRTDEIVGHSCSYWCGTTFSTLLQDTSTHDVTFKTSDGGSVSAHRVIVAAGSPVFHAMLYGNMKESSQKEIELTNIDSSTLKKVFCFIYTGCVEANFAKSLELLQAADYLNIGALESTCVEIIDEFINIHNYCDIAVFAVECQCKYLLKCCVDFMEDNLKEVLTSADFSSLPLQAVVALTECSHLEVKELDLFLAVVQWSKQRKGSFSAEDMRSAFRHIRYPLIRKADLVDKVFPTQLADPDLYKAALEYHNTNKFDGPQDQIRLREHYFDFDRSVHTGILVQHTAKGTLLTKTSIDAKKTKSIAPVFLIEDQPVAFILYLQSCSNKSKTRFRLSYESFADEVVSDSDNVNKIPLGEEVEGCIYLKDSRVQAKIGDVTLWIPGEYSLCYLSVVMYSVGDQVCILRN